ncbi:MAG: DNA-directed RNA polymerase subunit beta [Clostridiales bacterium]|jgi:DNA-directed RNA polymerase, beta subunit|nr:DNA-directed RNA polymerase subunit beta [Clostridiales bacterium]
MVHEILLGGRKKMSFSRIDEVLEMPNLIEIQKESYRKFVEEGLKEVFADISPITGYGDNLVLEFVDYTLDNNPKYSVEECKERDVNYAAPLRVTVRLINRETGEVKEQEVFMGDFPLMTETGTFIINGAERVIVSQLVRSPGAYYNMETDKMGKQLFSSTIIPNRGAWLEYETDANDVMWVRVDRTRKLPATVLMRALGCGTDEEILAKFGEEKLIIDTIRKDSAKTDPEGVIEIYKRLRPGEPPTEESARSLFNSLLFDPRRYDLARVGRYKINKKLGLVDRLAGQTLAADVINPYTGEVMAVAGQQIDRAEAERLQASGINEAEVVVEEGTLKIFGNNFVDLAPFVDFDLKEIGITEKAHFPTFMGILNSKESWEEGELRREMANRVHDLMPKHIHPDDIMASLNYMICLYHGVGRTDDIDHLGNRRLRCVGELLQNQIRVGLSRLERVVRERMSIQDMDVATPSNLINIRPVSAAIKEFFGSSQLSQFMDQTNLLAELTHKRRLSALGPGGLNRERASFEVRDVHHSHYGRMCPIETPEGPNIGLIGSLATYARVNEYGFIETPYRKVIHGEGVVTDEVVYITADEEDNYIVAQANESVDENGRFTHDRVTSRFRKEINEFPREQIDLMDVSPKQLVSVATAMIPFLENDDANRALMGSNMQRQAVPLLNPQVPVVGTGMEYKAAHDSGMVVLSKRDGVAKKVTADEIVIEGDDGVTDRFKLIKYKRSNQNTCINQRPLITAGQRVNKDQALADGPSTSQGEIALGRNILIGFMPWEGYNYEDAMLISEKMVKEDVFTSIHIEELECEARDTKLGPEEITRDIPNVGPEGLKDLDDEGIIRVGAEVHSGDILVGKVTPKGETELTAEERLLRAIFGEKAREVRDTSLRVPHGEGGIVVDVKIFTRENKDELPAGVNELVRVYIAQKRKISVGDKMAGRHGNKGVISRILPEEDMPFMPDGTPLEIVLNPLGVPSRMNIGQVLETHLGLAAKALGFEVATSVFDGATEEEIQELLVKAGYPADGKIQLRDGRSGEPFENPVTVGYMYILKLHHLVDEKIHARSTGPYSLVTQQPLGGKAQFGGQRFGEMEVWALEAYGAAHTLQEILTVKSDDVVGRVKTYEAIIKGENTPEPGIPESFKVLIKELQSLALDIKVLNENHEEIKIRDSAEEEMELMDRHEQERRNILLQSADYVQAADQSVDGDLGDETDIQDAHGGDAFDIAGVHEIVLDDDLLGLDDDAFADLDDEE